MMAGRQIAKEADQNAESKLREQTNFGTFKIY